MAKHEVTCLKCGRRFDANEGGSYLPESHRYICKKCVDKKMIPRTILSMSRCLNCVTVES